MIELAEIFAARYPAYVADRCRALGFEAPADAIEEGRAWLRAELAALLQQPFAEQRRGPLELFQEAMRFPTAALLEAGAEPVDRGEVSRGALPGDIFDLAPASSQDLGEEAWQAHLRWGAAKARALAGR